MTILRTVSLNGWLLSPLPPADFRMMSGDSLSLSVTVRDSSRAAVDHTGSTIAWSLAKRSAGRDCVLVTKTGTATSSGFTVTLDPSDTSDLCAGEYEHEAQVTDASGNVSTVLRGTLTLDRDVN